MLGLGPAAELTVEAASGEKLKISGLAEAAGVPVATVRHYLREGLLPEGEKTSRNMAYYPPELVERIRLIKQLQEERFMPLRVIGELLEREGGDGGPARGGRERSRACSSGRSPPSRRELRSTRCSSERGFPRAAFERLVELGILTPDGKGLSPSDVRIVEAISRFRAGGYDERIGFTVHDVERFLEPLTDLAQREVDAAQREDRRPLRARARRGAARRRARAAERPGQRPALEAAGCRGRPPQRRLGLGGRLAPCPTDRTPDSPSRSRSPGWRSPRSASSACPPPTRRICPSTGSISGRSFTWRGCSRRSVRFRSRSTRGPGSGSRTSTGIGSWRSAVGRPRPRGRARLRRDRRARELRQRHRQRRRRCGRAGRMRPDRRRAARLLLTTG